MIGKANLEDYLEKGMYGPKEIKADERKRFLGTIRERIVIALLDSQVYENKVYDEIVQEMKQHPQTKLLLSGKIPYTYLSKYIKIANKHNIPFTIVENKESQTDIGLVLAYENYAIEKDEIFVTEQTKMNQNKVENIEAPKKGIKGFIKKLFK